MATNRKMDKEDIVYIYNGMLAIKMTEIMPFAATWMDLETVIESEVSQKENNKYRILTHVCGT